MNIDVWTQPGLEIFEGNSIVSKRDGWGGAFSLRGHYAFLDSPLPIGVIAEFGYKSPGFLQGHALDASPIFMFGIGIQH